MQIEILIFTIIIFLIAAGMTIIIIPKLYKGHEKADEKDRLQVRLLYFAGVVLACLALVFLEAMGMYYFSDSGEGYKAGGINPGKEIFGACVQVIPPIATLVLGYYFGRSEK